MNSIKLLFIVAGAGLVALLGQNKYREIKAIKNVIVGAGDPPFRLQNVSGGIVTGLLGLVLSNPSSFKIEVQKLTMDIFLRGDLVAKVPPVTVIINPKRRTSVTIPFEITLDRLMRLGEDVILKPAVYLDFKGSMVYKSETLGLNFPIPFELALDVKKELNRFLEEKYGVAINP